MYRYCGKTSLTAKPVHPAQLAEELTLEEFLECPCYACNMWSLNWRVPAVGHVWAE